MNLHGVCSQYISAVNPLVPICVHVSTGYTTAADGKRTPTYADPVTVMAQLQPVSSADLRHLEGLNVQGNKIAIYINGRVDGLVRPVNQGGDLIDVAAGGPNDGTWLVTVVAEAWPDWVKVLCTLQNGG